MNYIFCTRALSINIINNLSSRLKTKVPYCYFNVQNQFSWRTFL
jgi:hypothetical protein